MLHLTFPMTKTFTIVAHQLSAENNFVQSVRLDGRVLQEYFLTHSDLNQGSLLEFEMSSRPPPPRH